MGYSLFNGNWGSSKDVGNKLCWAGSSNGKRPSIWCREDFANGKGSLRTKQVCLFHFSSKLFFAEFYFPTQLLAKRQPTLAQPSTDVTAKGNHIFRGNNISTGIAAAADLLPKAFPSDSLGFITFPSSGSDFHLEPVELSRPGRQQGLQAIGTQLLVEK